VFGGSVRAHRVRLGITQEELAGTTGLSVRTIRAIETGQIARPRPSTVRLLADAFGLTGADRDGFHQSAHPAGTALGGYPTPAQLPAPPQAFTGRTAELAGLDLTEDAATVVITAIDGMAGIGKTALAVHAAHRVADRYPDGQLFVDLHGYTQGMAPVEPGDVLDGMLRALGVPGEHIPPGLDERAALYRSRLADRRVLIVLDNAATEDQVTPLLPGTPGCLVLVTSRRRLAGLDHTRTVSLDVLPLPDAVTLFVRTVGEHRLAGQPPALLAETVELCGRLPLAIRIAAARLTSHAAWTLAHLADRLREHQHRLFELTAGQRSVTAALDLSYQQLPSDQRRTFRLLGLHPGPDIDAHATAALVNMTLAGTQRLLEQLLDEHLLQEPAQGRYAFHDLVRAHAAVTTRATDTDAERRTALTRLFDHYRYAAAAAMGVAYPNERERHPRIPMVNSPTPALPDATQAAAWLDVNMPNLLAVTRHGADRGWPEHTIHLSTILHHHLHTRGRDNDAETLHQRALTTAQGIGHRVGEVDALIGLGAVRRQQGLHKQAVGHNQRALRIAQAIGYQSGELYALIGLSQVHQLEGRYDQAADHHLQALKLARTIGYRAGELFALRGLGQIHLLGGRYDLAADHYQQALTTAQTIGYQIGELYALRGLGQVHLLGGRYDLAADHYQRALTIAEAIGYRAGELYALIGLGQVHRRQGRYAEATEDYLQTLDLARQIDDRNSQYEALQGLGRLHYATGRLHDALTHHQQALALATDLRQRADQARAHDGLAQAHRALHRPAQAREHWRQALDILTSLGTEHTEEADTTTATIRAHLAALDHAS
jgi:tetratricopeptide (TPR) repeat protein/transcriptional regulator with XRE-family HTH domain